MHSVSKCRLVYRTVYVLDVIEGCTLKGYLMLYSWSSCQMNTRLELNSAADMELSCIVLMQRCVLVH